MSIRGLRHRGLRLQVMRSLRLLALLRGRRLRGLRLRGHRRRGEMWVEGCRRVLRSRRRRQYRPASHSQTESKCVIAN
jgi:hypothetical protein